MYINIYIFWNREFINKSQLQTYLHFMNNNRSLLHNKISRRSHFWEASWQLLTAELNAVGTPRTKAQWIIVSLIKLIVHENKILCASEIKMFWIYLSIQIFDQVHLQVRVKRAFQWTLHPLENRLLDLTFKQIFCPGYLRKETQDQDDNVSGAATIPILSVENEEADDLLLHWELDWLSWDEDDEYD